MTHNNRGRISVDTAGNWRLYCNTLPAGAVPLGTVTRDGADTGALVRYEATGLYAQINAGAVRSLDGRKVAAALGLTGRPAQMEGGRNVNVYLDPQSIAVAQALGDGSISAGIRKALKSAQALGDGSISAGIRKALKSA